VVELSGLVAIRLAAAVCLAVILAVAAAAKARDRSSTASDFASLGLPRADLWAVGIPLLELASAIGLVLNPGWGGVVAFALLTAFTTNLVLIVRSGRVAHCACFGGSSAAPVSGRHLARNAVLLGLALAAATLDGWIWDLL
jgi:hypothetical protein